MSNINSRRGTSSSRHHRHYHANLDRLIQCFIITTAVIIIGGYYYFISSASSSVLLLHDNNNSGSSDIHNIRGGGGNSDNNRNNNNNNNAAKTIAKATIGYAITVSGCPKNNGSRGDFGAGIIDGAAVLKHSIHLNSIRAADTTATTASSTTGATSGSSGSRRSKYDYQMYALVHPTAEHCARSQLQPLGYTILIRDTPIPLNDIQGDYLRERVSNNGCCGDKEFVKLHAYTLVEHPVVVHLDLDTLVLKPMDDIFDLMIDGTTAYANNNEKKKIDVAFNDPIDTTTSQQSINAFFTRDYNMANHGMKHVGVQGGFLVLRPDLKVYEEFQEIIRVGDFRKNGGWGGMGFGPFYGVSIVLYIVCLLYACFVYNMLCSKMCLSFIIFFLSCPLSLVNYSYPHSAVSIDIIL
jgi:hypothetical protein